MFTLAPQLAALGLIDAARVGLADEVARARLRKECRRHADVAVKRVDADAKAASDELRRHKAEARRRYAEASPAPEAPKADLIELPAEAYRATAEAFAEMILRAKPGLSVDKVAEMVAREFGRRGYVKAA